MDVINKNKEEIMNEHEIMYQQTDHLNRVADAQKKIEQMTEEQIEQKLRFAKEQSDIIDLSVEDRMVIIEICRADEQRNISTMSTEEVKRMKEQIWDKYTQYSIGESEEDISVYERYYLSEIRRRLVQEKNITVSSVLKNALKTTSAEKCAEADTVEMSQLNPEHMKEGETKDD